ncbi:uncharacterized protein ACHE_20169S [Aspergillus chevalieri]|uniref:Alpha/beta hydrolase fold-3 domain-containing protein n=1 Tax=Aspergillus chevalieri TaxID=182096 RepID=A0A7R7ZKV3_ASPCH|nr:uncharacterized protein ACHE_20169S [Aspergillus chevalieri]BCR84711.1 hypothetical protein ACHE_20169S [Aspergillus chevalieri]
MSFFFYIYLKFAAVVIRSLARLQGKIISNPDAVRYIPSRDHQRTIKAHFYRSPLHKELAPGPVLINFHGSGFVIPAHGSDDAFCRQISERTNYSVLDIQYRLGPEDPFPAAVHDVEDVVKWVLKQSEEFDPSRVSISGFSAGGNLALVACSSLFPPATFHSVLAFYPSVEAFVDPNTLAAPESGGTPLPAWLLRFFKQCYVPSNVDAKDPRISPYFADPIHFPRNVLIIAAGYDSLALEAERLAARLGEDADRHVVYERMEKCDHAWDKIAREGTREWELKSRAYELAIGMLEM